MRRGKVTIHKKWDQNIGILSGDLLMIFAYKMLEDIEEDLSKKHLKGLIILQLKFVKGNNTI